MLGDLRRRLIQAGRVADIGQPAIPRRSVVAKTPMSDEHKAALSEGRRNARSVREYLEALEQNRPKRGRRRTPASIRSKLDSIEQSIGTASPLKRLQLVQERTDLEAELRLLEDGPGVDLEALEKAFVADAKNYATAKGIGYAAWREVGVEPRVLAAAGITRNGT